MHGKSVDLNNAMWVCKAILAYLNGEESLGWVLSVIDDGDNWTGAQQFVRDLHDYGDPERCNILRRRLDSNAA